MSRIYTRKHLERGLFVRCGKDNALRDDESTINHFGVVETVHGLVSVRLWSDVRFCAFSMIVNGKCYTMNLSDALGIDAAILVARQFADDVAKKAKE